MALIKPVFSIAVFATFSLTACGNAQTESDDHTAMNMKQHDMSSMSSNGTMQNAMTTAAMGRVTAIDQKNGMVTIEHGPIDALKWPTMTMPFVADPKHLSSIKTGDLVDVAMMTKPNEAGKYALKTIRTMHVDRSKLSPSCVSKMADIKSLDAKCMADMREAVPHKH